MDITLKDRVIRAHINDNYPNAQIKNWNDPDSSLAFYPAEELTNAPDGWFPLCCYRDETTGQTVYGGQAGILHTYTEGETGAGKTSRYAMQSIRALSATKHKPSFLVVDIHGELVENLYDHLKAAGYNIRILNCDDPRHSDTYNPFAPLVQRCLQTGEIDNETVSQIRKIAEIIQPVEDTKDPIWDQGARSYTNGLILDKFEDLLKGKIPPECITIYNIIENHYWLRTKLGPRDTDLRNIPHYKAKPGNALSVQKLLAVTNNADRTRASYMGVVENHFDTFAQPSLYRLSSSSTIDIEEFIHQPTAVFIQSGTTSIGDDLISLMTNEIYNTAVRIGRQSATKMLPRKIHCFLDEFANSNIAEGQEFIRMLTTSRKFGMYWHMLLQSDAQLERKFDANIGRIIRSNCTEIFMGSHDYATLERFAKSCGKRTVESLSSLVAAQTPALETVDLITADKLSLMPQGYLYVKTNRQPLLYSYIEAFYKCPEFVPKKDILSVYPVNDFDYTETVFFPSDLLNDLSEDEFRLLRLLRQENEPVLIRRLQAVLPKAASQFNMATLKKKGVVESDDDIFYGFSASKRGYELLEKQYPNAAPVELPPKDAILPEVDSVGEEDFGSLLDEIFDQKEEPTPLVVALDAHFKKNNISRETLKDATRSTVFPAAVALDLERLRTFGIDRFHGTHLPDPQLSTQIAQSFITKNYFAAAIRYVTAFIREMNRISASGVFPEEMQKVLSETVQILKGLKIEDIRAIRNFSTEEDE